MRTHIIRIECVMQSSFVGNVKCRSRNGHGGGGVIVILKGIVPVHACTCELYA